MKECKDFYWSVSRIFNVRDQYANFILDEHILEMEIKRTVRARFGDENTLLDTFRKSDDQSCNTFVVALNTVSSGLPTIIRSYHTDVTEKPRVTIWQAARATTACPTMFAPIFIPTLGGSFVDGAMGFSNPSELAMEEMSIIAPDDVTQKICLVSIGSGRLRAIEFPDSSSPWLPNFLNVSKQIRSKLLLAEKCMELLTCTEVVHQRLSVRARSSKASNELQYYRFNVEHGMEDISWGDVTKLTLAESTAREYLNEHETREKVKSCVKDLMDLGEIEGFESF